MKCEVLLFAQLRDAVGCDRLTIDLPERATVADALKALASQHRAIDESHDRLAVAVNERYARQTDGLRDRDVIALIPPVSGSPVA